MLGHYSHGTIHSFLGASEGSEFIRTWKLPTPTKIADKLKVNLLGEMATAEWELLDEREWDDEPAEGQHDHETPTSRNSQPHTNHSGENGQVSAQAVEEGRRTKGTSGWTKLNNR